MLFLLFQLGADRYALDASRVVEVLPLLELKPMPHAPRGVVGMFNWRGEPVIAVDLGLLLRGIPASDRLTTRMILISYADAAGRERRVGLIAENVTRTLRRDREEFAETGMRLGATPYLGPVLLDEHGVVQWVQEDKLLPNEVRGAVFA
jgi:chemotaxis-related protein WspB